MAAAEGRKHIMVYSIHYHPEMIGIGVFNHGLARYLAGKGYDVTVVTAFPWYPYWKVMEGYRGRFLTTGMEEGVRVKRSYVYSAGKVNAKTRILHQAVFAASSLFNLASLLFKKIDLAFVVCPPFGIGLIARWFCKLKGIPFIFHVQDLEVDAAFDTGILKNRLLMRILKGLENYVFKKAALITTISNGMRNRIAAKGIDIERIKLLPNWIDAGFMRPVEPGANRFRAENGIPEDKFLALYAGNIGEKQGVEIIIETAAMTAGEKDILYLIVGDGANSGRLKADTAERGLENVAILPLQPKEMLPHMLAAADISLIIQKKTVGDIVMPSKLLNIMASRRPVVATAAPGCELARFINECGCGIAVEPEEPLLLKDAVLKLRGDPLLRRRCGEKGWRHAKEKLSAGSILGAFAADLEKLILPWDEPYQGLKTRGFKNGKMSVTERDTAGVKGLKKNRSKMRG